MNLKQKGLMIFFILLIAGSLGLKFFYDYKESGYGRIKITFEEINEVQLGTSIDPIELIKNTNAEEIIYPSIDTSLPGIQELFYVGLDSFQNERVFVFELNVVNSVFPRLTLNQEQVEIFVGDAFDTNTYIDECFDETDGALEATFEEVDTSVPGTFNILIEVTDSNNHTSSATLKLIIKEKSPPEVGPGINSPIQPTIKPPVGDGEQTPPTLPTNPQTPPQAPNTSMAPHEKWLFDRGDGNGGYSYQDAFNACINFGKTNAINRFECLPISKEGEPIGYQISY